MADVINDLIIDSVKKLGASALTITHDMASARKIADRIAMLYQGKIIWQGTVAEMDKTDNPYGLPICQRLLERADQSGGIGHGEKKRERIRLPELQRRLP